MVLKSYIKNLTYFGFGFYVVGKLSPIFQPFMPLWIDQVVSIIFQLMLSILLFKITKKLCFKKWIKPENKAVLITGCDSGFGNLLAKSLDSEGFRVYATCLQPEGPGATELKQKSSENLKVLEMDVTKDESVSKAAEFIKKDLGSYELWAVVNNAGICKGSSTDLSKLQDFKDCLEVNLIGMVRVTDVFLPLLKKSKGRIVNVASYAGRMALPFVTPYTVSKFAAVGFNDSLRREMDVWGVRVISIEPELFRTPMTEFASRRLDKEFSSLDASLIEDYGNAYLEKLKTKLTSRKSQSPKVFNVIEDIKSAITLESPDIVYKPSRNYAYKTITYLFPKFPACVQDMGIKLVLFINRFPKPKKG